MPRPEPQVLAALLQVRRSRHLCSWGGRDAAGAPGSLSQTQSLSPKGREVDKEPTLYLGRVVEVRTMGI